MLRDDSASVRLLERALALTPRADRAPVLVELANALDEVGDLERCAATAAEALDLARMDGDRRTAARARVVQLRMAAVRSTGETDPASFNAAARPVLDEPEALGDDEGMAAMLVHLGLVNQDCFATNLGPAGGTGVPLTTGGEQDPARQRVTELEGSSGPGEQLEPRASRRGPARGLARELGGLVCRALVRRTA